MFDHIKTGTKIKKIFVFILVSDRPKLCIHCKWLFSCGTVVWKVWHIYLSDLVDNKRNGILVIQIFFEIFKFFMFEKFYVFLYPTFLIFTYTEQWFLRIKNRLWLITNRQDWNKTAQFQPVYRSIKIYSNLRKITHCPK